MPRNHEQGIWYRQNDLYVFLVKVELLVGLAVGVHLRILLNRKVLLVSFDDIYHNGVQDGMKVYRFKL